MHLTNDYGILMNHKKIKRIMKKYGLITKVRKKNPYKDIMKKTQEHRTFPNILNRNFLQLIPSRVFCTDITYLFYNGRKAYLSVVKDIATHEIVSWKLSNNLSMKFVLDSINILKGLPGLTNETILHSDQGFHYTNPEYIKLLQELNLIQSMSRKGTCIDNSPIESFFGHFKDGLEFKDAKTFAELHDMVNQYMVNYNFKYYQWNIQKMTPVQYRDHLLAKIA